MLNLLHQVRMKYVLLGVVLNVFLTGEAIKCYQCTYYTELKGVTVDCLGPDLRDDLLKECGANFTSCSTVTNTDLKQSKSPRKVIRSCGTIKNERKNGQCERFYEGLLGIRSCQTTCSTDGCNYKYNTGSASTTKSSVRLIAVLFVCKVFHELFGHHLA